MQALAERRRVLVQGAVQGVGFRPFVYKLAIELGICGWVINSAQGVVIEAEAPAPQLDHFILQINEKKPPHSIIQHLTVEAIPCVGENKFEIRHSDNGGSRSTIILPDLATCPDCLQEIFDPANRRYHYPFTNCTHCGPRYSIINRLPYDRPNTTMQAFVMCPACRAEYENPLDRRFHAQPIACPHCGPQLALWDQHSKSLAIRNEALIEAASLLRKGAIIAVKGIGGFQLLVDARSRDAVRQLRQRKHRPDKPFAVMIPTLAQVKNYCHVSEREAQLLGSSEAPIVLLEQFDNTDIVSDVAPDNPYLGVMLPYTPLHHLLMAELGFPIVATSGNLSSEPICIDEVEAVKRLRGIADYFLVHDRPIARPVDDSVVRVMAGTAVVLRRARGYAPLPIEIPTITKGQLLPIVATGAHLKNTVAVSVDQQVIVSQHIGDLVTPESITVFKNTVDDLQCIYEQPPALIACDLHPDYQSTKLAEALAQKYNAPLVRVQHHYAHVLACMAEHQLSPPVLGIAWDGTGHGTDGTIWGSEFLTMRDYGFERSAYLRPFRLPGGEKAIHEPRRIALGLLHEIYGHDLPINLGFSSAEMTLLQAALFKGINAPITSSMGRFFDAIAALIGLRDSVTFEGQAAMELEFASHHVATDKCYQFQLVSENEHLIIDYEPVVREILDDLAYGTPISLVAATVHNSLIEVLGLVAERIGIEQVVLSGGCFQNKRLLEGSINRLQKLGFQVYWPQKYPPNDGSIALGQVIGALRQRDISNSSSLPHPKSL
jgi:hydrogenase maturation protein HypF